METGTREGTLPEETGRLRRILLALLLLGIVGLAAELVLLEHTESVWQWVPLAALAVGFAGAVQVLVRPTRRALRFFQAVMVAFVAVGVLGLYLHLRGNLEFERENDPAVRGLDLLWRAMHGATPALAPGALAQLGLLGLACAFRHPALTRRTPIKETR
ncbi:MAG TPA: hypothetical protein VHG28_00385 [Longimicrobiaceae bacterium]|nr:hypothetical protein [Longimicrobiaceae bacterium]